MTREVKPRAESSNAPPEAHVCVLCHRRYTNEATHVVTDAHLEAMADESVREWLALPLTDPDSEAFAKQIARMEHFYSDYEAWRRSMGLPDTPDTFAVHRRIAAIWIRALAEPDYEARMAYARVLIDMELGLVRIEGGKR